MNSIASLQSADFAVGSRIIEALKDIDPSTAGPLACRRGVNPSKWIYRAPDSVDLPAMLKMISGHKGVRAQLPMIIYSRQRGLNSMAPDQAVNVQGAQLFNTATLSNLKVDIAWLELNYSVVAVGTTQEQAEFMMMMWYFHISRRNNSNHVLNMDYLLGQNAVPVKGFIQDSRSLLTSDYSIPEHKIFGLRHDFIVEAPALYGEKIDVPNAIKVGFKILQVQDEFNNSVN